MTSTTPLLSSRDEPR
uniref:Uncharacterized protein n=1 Tax=Moniliophthora roreri TaxID=221103 RepID=A0A0W0ETB5_MONRR